MSDRVMAWSFPAGQIKGKFETLGAVTEKKFTVPALHLWMPQGMLYAERDANAALDIALYDENDKLLLQLTTQIAAGVTDLSFPFDAPDAGSIAAWAALKGMVMLAGWYVKITWGAAQTTPEVSFPVLEIPL